MIGIINTQSANIKSISNIYYELGVNHTIINQRNDFKNVSKLIIPGIGSFDSIIENLKNLDLFDMIDNFAIKEKKPILGICIGMQIFFNKSEEGNKKGFGWIDNNVEKLNLKNIRYPHVGWNNVKMDKENPLFENINNDSYFYFLHSFGIKKNKKDTKSSYGSTYYGEEFISVIISDNLYGVQFHPEKSHNNGMKFLENFSKI